MINHARGRNFKRDMVLAEEWIAQNFPEREPAPTPVPTTDRQRNLEIFLPRIAARYSGRRELIHISAVTKTIEEEQLVKVPIERIFEKDAGPIWWLWLILGALLSLGAIAGYIADTTMPFSVLSMVGGGLFIALRGRYRHIRRRTVTECRDTLQKVAKEIVVTPKSYEERMLPGHMEVAAVGRLALPFLVVQAGQGALLLAPETGVAASQQLEYPEIRSASELLQALETLNEKTTRIPSVLNDDPDHPVSIGVAIGEQGTVLRGLEREIYQGYKEVARIARNLDRTVFSFSPLPMNHPLLPVLRPISQPWSGEFFLEGLELEQKLHGDTGEVFDQLLADAMRGWAGKQLVMHAVRLTSLSEGIAPQCRELGRIFEYSAFNFYCPTCAADQHNDLMGRDYSLRASGDYPPLVYLPETRCIFDPNRESWYCPACGSETPYPVPVHRMLDEVMLPAYDRLLEENKNERTTAYSRAREQELGYQNRLEAEMEELIRKNREAVETLRTDKQHNEAGVQGELRALQSLRELRQGFAAELRPSVRKIFEEQANIQRNFELARAQGGQKLDQAYEESRRDIQTRFSQLKRTEYLEKRKRDELQISAIHRLKGIQGLDQGQLQHQADIYGEMTGLSRSTQQEFADLRTPIQDGFDQGNAIAVAVIADEGMEPKAPGNDIAGRARSALRSAAELLAGEDSSAGERMRLEKR